MSKKNIISICLFFVFIIGCFVGVKLLFNKNEIKDKDINLANEKEDVKVDLGKNDTSNKQINEEESNVSNNEVKEEVKDEPSTNDKKEEVIDSSSNKKEKEEIIIEDIPSKFELMSLGNLQYYLYIPSNPSKDMPLIMYLHGGTNKKLGAKELLTTDGFPKYLYDGYYGNLRSYVVIPKLDSNYTGWVNIYSELRNLIKFLNTEYSIDLNKVSLTGHSMGGTGTYQVQIKLSNSFACIAPMSGSVKNTEENIEALSKTKVWAFVGLNDTIVDPSSSIEIINTLKYKGIDAKITEFEGTDHFEVPSLGYKNREFISWLVNCSK